MYSIVLKLPFPLCPATVSNGVAFIFLSSAQLISSTIYFWTRFYPHNVPQLTPLYTCCDPRLLVAVPPRLAAVPPGERVCGRGGRRLLLPREDVQLLPPAPPR